MCAIGTAHRCDGREALPPAAVMAVCGLLTVRPSPLVLDRSLVQGGVLSPSRPYLIGDAALSAVLDRARLVYPAGTQVLPGRPGMFGDPDVALARAVAEGPGCGDGCRVDRGQSARRGRLGWFAEDRIAPMSEATASHVLRGGRRRAGWGAHLSVVEEAAVTPVHQSWASIADPAAGCRAAGEPAFVSSSGLRALLDRLSVAGRDAWRTDPEASALLAYTMDRYAPLARVWHRDPGDAAAAAFLAMIHDGVRRAEDPWAVVTRAVQISLSAENHAERHLTSTEKARRIQHADIQVPIRTADYTDTLAASSTGGPGLADAEDAEPAGRVVADAALLLRVLGWPHVAAEPAVEYVCARLADAGSIPAGYEALRRDTHIRAQLDLDRSTWTGLLRVLLGARPLPGRPTRKGVLARLLLGETVTDLLEDDQLVRAVLATLPRGRCAGGPDDPVGGTQDG